MKIKFLPLLIILPFAGSAQTFEIGAGAGVSINSKPTQNQFYKGDIIVPNYAANLTALVNLKHNWQAGIDIHVLGLSRKSSVDFPQLYTDYAGGKGKKFIYGRVTSSLCVAVNKKINTKTGYFYAGAEVGLGIAHSSNTQSPSGNAYYIAPDGGYGLVFGPHAGYTRYLTKAISLNAEVAALFYDVHNSAIAPFSASAASLHYQIAAFPLTVGIRYNLKTAKKSDHPVNAESASSMIMHNGYITTDQKGIAVIKLPNKFDSLFKVFRYQLTVIGSFAQAVVSKELNGNSFEIKTDQPNVKVNWSIISIMKDAAANIDPSLYGGEKVLVVNQNIMDKDTDSLEAMKRRITYERQQKDQDSLLNNANKILDNVNHILNNTNQILNNVNQQQVTTNQNANKTNQSQSDNGTGKTQQPYYAAQNNTNQGSRQADNSTSRTQQPYYAAQNNTNQGSRQADNSTSRTQQSYTAPNNTNAGEDTYPATSGPAASDNGYPTQSDAAQPYAEDISTPILFEAGQAVIREYSFPVLEEAIKEMRENQNAFVVIHGYTDNIGLPDSNITLSFKRADAVKTYFIEKGVDPKKIIKVGHGDNSPINTNSTPEGRARNRRVTITIKHRS